MTPTQIVHLRASFILLQNADYPLFTKSLTLHQSSSFINLKVENSSSQWPGFRGKGQRDSQMECLLRFRWNKKCRDHKQERWTILVSGTASLRV